MADPGEGPGGPCPPLFLDQTETRRAEKYFFGDRPPSLNFIRLLRVVITTYRPALSQSLDDRAPPYLKVWIGHCVVNLTQGFIRILTVQKLEFVQACQPG